MQPDSRIPNPESRFLESGSRFTNPNFRVLTFKSKFANSNACNWVTAARLLRAGSRVALP